MRWPYAWKIHNVHYATGNGNFKSMHRSISNLFGVWCCHFRSLSFDAILPFIFLYGILVCRSFDKTHSLNISQCHYIFQSVSCLDDVGTEMVAFFMKDKIVIMDIAVDAGWLFNRKHYTLWILNKPFSLDHSTINRV